MVTHVGMGQQAPAALSFASGCILHGIVVAAAYCCSCMEAVYVLAVFEVAPAAFKAAALPVTGLASVPFRPNKIYSFC